MIMEQVDTKVCQEKEVKLLEVFRELLGEIAKKLKQEKEQDLAQEIYDDREYTKIVENSGLQDRIKKIILAHGPFSRKEIYVFVEENLNRPILEEIFNDFKGNEGITNAMKKCGVTDINPIMPHLIRLEFFGVNKKC